VRVPHRCPSCGKDLRVTVMKCESCGAGLEGNFDPCPVCRFDPELQSLFDLFMTSRGNLKDVERRMDCSYPTVRSRMEEMFRRYEEVRPLRPSRMDVLKRLRRGEITAAEAERLLRETE
jgi:hypothetical protein